MRLPLDKLNYSFTKKPLLVGGMAEEKYLEDAKLIVKKITDDQYKN